MHCGICQVHYNGNVLAEALKVVEYHRYNWYKSRGVRSRGHRYMSMSQATNGYKVLHLHVCTRAP